MSRCSGDTIGAIFDCDGTLLDSMQAWRLVEAELARQAGAELTAQDKAALTTFSIPECGHYMHTTYGVGASGKDVEDLIIDFMFDFYSTRSVEKSGARALLQSLAAYGVHLSVASSTPQKCLEAGLSHCEMLSFFDAVVSVDSVGESKRSPAVYEYARARMGVQRDRTWVIEDARYALVTARDAGYRTIAIYDCDISGTPEELAQVADIYVESFAELHPEMFFDDGLLHKG